MHQEPESEARLTALLRNMITPIRRARETPLQFEIDSSRIVDSALREYNATAPPGSSPPPGDWDALTAALEDLVAKTLVDESAGISPQREADGGNRGATVAASGDRSHHPLAAWLQDFFQATRDVDPRAFEVFGLRLEGYQDRDIADRLGLGLRLVRRILREMQPSGSTAAKRG